MSRRVKLIMSSAFMFFLVACGSGSSGEGEAQKDTSEQESQQSGDDAQKDTATSISLHGLSPVESDNLAGIWIGETEYTEKESFTDYHYDYAGTRTMIIKMVKSGQSSDGTRTFYDVVNCYGNEKHGSYNSEENSAVLLSRQLSVQNFNQMTGTSVIAEHGDEDSGNENWAWIKISNSTADIGQTLTTVSLLNDDQTDPEPMAHGLKSFCRDSHSKTPVGRNLGVETIDLDLYGLANNKNYIVAKYASGYEDAYVGPLSLNLNNQDQTFSREVSNAAISEYQVSYSIEGQNYEEYDQYYNKRTRGPYEMTISASVVVPSL